MATINCSSKGPADTQTEISSLLCRRCGLRCFYSNTVIKMIFFYPSTRIWQVQSDTTQTLLSSSGRSSAPFLFYLCKIKFLDEETVYVTHLIDKSLQCFSAVWSSFWRQRQNLAHFLFYPVITGQKLYSYCDLVTSVQHVYSKVTHIWDSLEMFVPNKLLFPWQWQQCKDLFPPLFSNRL